MSVIHVYAKGFRDVLLINGIIFGVFFTGLIVRWNSLTVVDALLTFSSGFLVGFSIAVPVGFCETRISTDINTILTEIINQLGALNLALIIVGEVAAFSMIVSVILLVSAKRGS